MKKKRNLEEDFELLDMFNGRCPKCRSWATTIHELEPRSRGSRSMRLTNRTPICFSCHDEFHRLGASKENIERWKRIIEKYLKSIGNWDMYHDKEELNDC